jgi:plastocyanin
VGVAGACLGAIAIGTASDASATTGMPPETLAALPALTTRDMEFDRTEIRVRAGDVVALRLENEDRMAHSLDIDELGVHVAMPPGTPALALFRVNRPGAYTFYCAPHYDR